MRDHWVVVQYDTPLQIIMHPRDTFVRNLTGADNVLRRLSLLNVRYNSPSLGFFRIVANPVEIGGTILEPGERVFVLFSAANHDATHFAEPERFNPHRENVGSHVGFGAGIHFCLGAPLARLEMRVALERLNARLPGLRLLNDQELRYKPNLTLRGLERLLVEWNVDDHETM